MRKLTLLSCVIVLSGCASANPQTREEFRQMKLSGAPFSLVDSHIAKRRFEDVVRTLRQKVDECFQVNVTTTRTVGGTTAMNQTDEFRTTIQVVHKDRAELTTQFTMKGATTLQKVPPGGFYSTAMDIERMTPTTTKLTYYGSSLSGGKAKWTVFKQWSDGQPVPCP